MKILAIYLTISCILVAINIIVQYYCEDEPLMEWLQTMKDYKVTLITKIGIVAIVLISSILIVIPNNILDIIKLIKKDPD